jgi:uncharacterized protein
MGLVAVTAGLFALGAYLGRDLSYGWGWVWFIAAAPTIAYYADANPQILWQAGGATALFIGGFGAVGYATRRDLSAYARVLFWALIGLIVYGIVLIFAQIPNGELVYAIVGLVIFAGLTVVDFQRVQTTRDVTSAPQLAASIFLDALNVFTLFLSLFGGGGRSQD